MYVPILLPLFITLTIIIYTVFNDNRMTLPQNSKDCPMKLKTYLDKTVSSIKVFRSPAFIIVCTAPSL